MNYSIKFSNGSKSTRLLVICISVFLFTGMTNLMCAGGRNAISDEDAIRFLIPRPRHIEKKPKAHFVFSEETGITVEEGLDEPDIMLGSHISGTFTESGLTPLKTSQAAITGGTEGIIIGSLDNSEIQKMLAPHNTGLEPNAMREGYILDVSPRRIIIAAHTPRGRFYGAQTLMQLLLRDKKKALIPGIFIKDWPEREIRGFIDDISNGQVSTETDFKNTVKTMARYKLNTCFLYMDDMFTPTAYPLIGAQKGAFSARMIQELDDEAAKYHVSLVPVFPWAAGHEDILSIPELTSLGVFPGSSCFEITKSESKTFFTDYITSLLDAISGGLFVLDGGRDAESAAAALKAQGHSIKIIQDVYLDYIRLANSIANSTGKTLYLFVPSFLTGRIEDLPPTVGIIDDSEAGASSIRPGAIPLIKTVPLSSSYRCAPDYRTFFSELSGSADGNAAHRYKGIIPSFLHRGGEEYFRKNGWPAYLFGAWQSWNPGESADRVFIACFLYHFINSYHSRLENALRQYFSLTETPPEGWNTYREFWYIPFTRNHSDAEIQFTIERSRTLRAIKEQIESLYEDNSEFPERLAPIMFSLEQELWVARKVEYTRRIIHLESLLSAGIAKKDTPTEITSLASELIRDLYRFQDSFKKIWLRSNQQAGLDFHVQRFNDQITVLDQKIRDIKDRKYDRGPLVPSQWITGGESGTSSENETGIFFRKTFTVKDNVQEVFIQVKCGPQSELYVNGQIVGTTASRSYDSPSLLRSSVSIINVTPYIRAGGNCIAVSVPVAYKAANESALHVFCEIRYRDNSGETLISDSSWKISHKPNNDWRTPEFDDSGWENASVTATPLPMQSLDFFVPNISRIPGRN